MEEHTTIQAKQSESTKSYGVYDSPDGDEQQQMVGTYIAESVADELGEFIEVELSEGTGDGLTLTADKETASFVVFSSDADAVEAAYISHEVLDEIGADAESTLNMQARSSSEEDFEQALDEQTVSEEETEEEAADLLADDSDDSDEEQDADADSDDEEASAQEKEEAELVPDEEVGL